MLLQWVDEYSFVLYATHLYSHLTHVDILLSFQHSMYTHSLIHMLNEWFCVLYFQSYVSHVMFQAVDECFYVYIQSHSFGAFAAHCRSLPLIAAHCCSLLLIAAHCRSLPLIAAHCCSLLLIAAHCCSLPLIAAHCCSLSTSTLCLHVHCYSLYMLCAQSHSLLHYHCSLDITTQSCNVYKYVAVVRACQCLD